MEEKKILSEIRNQIGFITFNSPQKLNSLAGDIRAGLIQTLGEYKMDRSVRAIIITGNGEAFSAGGDLQSMLAEGTVDNKRDRFVNGLNALPRLITEIEKPIIAAVNGYAIGAGCTLAMSCDLIVASQNARFGVSFNKMGLCPDAGGTYFLPRAVGLAKAKELAFTGRTISAVEAERLGIVNAVVPPEKLLEAAEHLARDIIVWPRAAIGLTKKLLNQGADDNLYSALEREAFAQAHCMVLPDHKEAVKAFLEKRDPIFSK